MVKLEGNVDIFNQSSQIRKLRKWLLGRCRWGTTLSTVGKYT